MALSGMHLRVAAGIWVPWVLLEHDEKGKLIEYSGIFIEFLDMFASKLNFTYSILEAPDGEWGRILPNGSATGMVGLCHRKEVDMALGPFSITLVRTPFIDYSVPVYVDNSGIFLPRPTHERDLTGFAKPFAWQVWICLLVFLIISMVLGYGINRIIQGWTLNSTQGASGHPRSNQNPKVFSPSWLLELLVAEPVHDPPTAITGRVFLATWMLAAVILSTAYQGTLTSLLAVPRVEIPVDSLQDLVEYGKIPWANEYGTSLHQFFGIISDDFSETGECNYYIAKESIWYSNFALAFPKHSKLVPHFNGLISHMKEGGVVSRYRDLFTSNATHCMVKPGKEGGHKKSILSLDDLTGIFLLFLGGIILGIILLTAEVVVFKMK